LAIRISIVYQIVNLLVYFEPAALCELPSDLILAPLPARKQLWEADNELVWKSEQGKEPAIPVAFGLAANGEVVKLSEEQPQYSNASLLHESLDSKVQSRDTASWEDWCSGMDGLGTLIMLAASLIE
jgi:hypothetical protein